MQLEEVRITLSKNNIVKNNKRLASVILRLSYLVMLRAKVPIHRVALQQVPDLNFH